MQSKCMDKSIILEINKDPKWDLNYVETITIYLFDLSCKMKTLAFMKSTYFSFFMNHSC